ncbi:15704_t:CDS:2, partial [Acaulospora morrowiae]
NESRISMQAVIDSKGKIYTFGGYHVPQFLSGSLPPSITILNNMIIINTILAKNYSIVNTTSGIMGRAYYSATMLDDSIFYIGGIDSSYRSVRISNIIMYNTSTNQWANINVNVTGSAIIENRYGHTAVLTPNKSSIIIYGGITDNGISPDPPLFFLNTTLPYTWNILPRDETFPPPSAFHTANIVGDYMIIAFGQTTNSVISPTKSYNKIYLFDINASTWVPVTTIRTDLGEKLMRSLEEIERFLQ